MNAINYYDIAFSVLLFIGVALNIQVYRDQYKEKKQLREENMELKLKLKDCDDDK